MAYDPDKVHAMDDFRKVVTVRFIVSAYNVLT